MSYLLRIILLTSILLILIYHFVNATELRIREDSKLFVRLNIKLNSFEHTKVFAYAIGYRVNFDLRKSKKSKLYMDQNVINSYFQPEQIRKTTEILFNLYGWNGTACIVRSLCEIYQIPHQPTDLFGPIMKLLFFGTEYPYVKKQFCEDGARCPVSILHTIYHRMLFP